MIFKFEPNIDIFEEIFKKTLKKPLLELENLEKVLGYYEKEGFFEFFDINTDLEKLSKMCDSLLVAGFYHPYALIAFFDLFECYLVQKKSFISDVVNEFQVKFIENSLFYIKYIK